MIAETTAEHITMVEKQLKRHHLWSGFGGVLKYLYSNIWDKTVCSDCKQKIRRFEIAGVEVRDLPEEHILQGEQGLFATKKFERYDIIGEYTGQIVPCTVGGHYCACLEDKPNIDDCMSVNAQNFGNEMRFINAFQGIGSRANVKMRTAYINTIPHIMIICTEDIEEGEELLLDYGEAYNKEYLTPKEVKAVANLSWNTLPNGDEHSSDEAYQKPVFR